MPGYFTHYIFGTATFNRMESGKCKKNITRNKCVYSLGLQGPDVFFHFLPSYVIHKENLGVMMHESRTGAFLCNLIKSRNSFIEASDRAIAEAYILGFLGHYALDTHCHPYIYAMTGYDLNRTPAYSSHHMDFETSLDQEMLDYYKHMKPSEFPIYKTIRLNMRQWRVVASMLNEAIFHTYPEYRCNYTMMKAATSSMIIGFGFLADPKARKKPFFEKIEDRFFSYRPLSILMPSDGPLRHLDPCNVLRQHYVNPWTKKEENQTFYQLFDEALESYLTYIHVANRLFSSGINGYDLATLEHMKSLLGNRSYHSGLPLDE